MTRIPLDPEIAAFNARVTEAWKAHPALSSLSFPEARAVAEQVRAPWRSGGPVMAGTSERTVALPSGALRLRIHAPVAGTGQPALLYLHGGGFTYFSLDTHDRLMREYAAQGGFTVIGVDYPLSPEAKYPVALDLLVELIDWLESHGAELGIDPARMAKDYELVQTYLGMEKPFAVETVFNTSLLDTAIKMDASKVSK